MGFVLVLERVYPFVYQIYNDSFIYILNAFPIRLVKTTWKSIYRITTAKHAS